MQSFIYAVIQCNREDCPIKGCIYNFPELPEGLLPKVAGGGKVVIGDIGLYCELGGSVGLAYFFEEEPCNVPNVYVWVPGRKQIIF
jgi:hypothetical protein